MCAFICIAPALPQVLFSLSKHPKSCKLNSHKISSLSPFPVSVSNTFLVRSSLTYFQCKPGWLLPTSPGLPITKSVSNWQ